jgi:hypothetical protein
MLIGTSLEPTSSAQKRRTAAVAGSPWPTQYSWSILLGRTKDVDLDHVQ